VADVIEDVQERLLYRAEVYIRENVVNYQFTEEDFNYPAVLLPEPASAVADVPPQDNDKSGELGVSAQEESPLPNGTPPSETDKATAAEKLSPTLPPNTSNAVFTNDTQTSSEGTSNDESKVEVPNSTSTPLKVPTSAVQGQSTSASPPSAASPATKRTSVASIPTLPQQKQPAKRHTWCPVLEKSLLCLSKMYRCVEVGRDHVVLCIREQVKAYDMRCRSGEL